MLYYMMGLVKKQGMVFVRLKFELLIKQFKFFNIGEIGKHA